MFKRLAARLPITLATFLFSLFATAALTRAPAPTSVPAPYSGLTLVAKATPAAPNGRDAEPVHAPDKGPRVSQQEIVNFPGLGRVSVSAVETFGESLHLEFRDAQTGRLLDTQYFGGTAPSAELMEMNPFLRFTVMHVRGLPDPLIVGVAVTPGVSGSRWQSVAVGAVDGELRDLTFESLEASNLGGLYYGDLGGGRGPGAASWNWVWGYDDEGHYGPHRYELTVYRWNPESGRFDWDSTLRTRAKFESGKKAVRSLGYHLSDVRKSFPDFADFGLE